MLGRDSTKAADKVHLDIVVEQDGLERQVAAWGQKTALFSRIGQKPEFRAMPVSRCTPQPSEQEIVVAKMEVASIFRTMTVNRKFRRTSSAALLALMPLLAAGCSGIHATKSVAPIDFLMPTFGHCLPSCPAAPGISTDLVSAGTLAQVQQ